MPLTTIANSNQTSKSFDIDVQRAGPARPGVGHVGPRADRAGPPPCCGPRVWPMVRSVGHFPGPCRPFSPVPRADPQPDKHIMSQFTNFFLIKVNFFHKSQHMKEATYNFIVSSKTYLNSQVISKRKSTESQHIEQNEPLGRAAIEPPSPPGRTSPVPRADATAHGPVRQRAVPPVARKHRTGPCHGPGHGPGQI